MRRILTLVFVSFLLAIIPACGAGGIDSRNKDLDRPKSPNERPAEPVKK
jgi:hypothetical protein